MLEALVDIGVANKPKYDWNNFVGQEIDVTDDKADANNVAGTGIVEGNTVALKCTDSSASETTASPPSACTTEANILTQSFSLKSGPTLSGKQWKEIATKLESVLNREGAQSMEDIKVTA